MARLTTRHHSPITYQPMQMTDTHRAKTGAYYTPSQWARLAERYLAKVVPCLDGFTVYDPAAGEGALLDALPDGTERVGSTLERADVEILLRKGYTAQQFDFSRQNLRFLDESILEASQSGTLIVLTNPPYRKMAAGECALMKRTHHECCGDLTALFLLRALRELKPALICSFTKTDIYQATSMKPFRDAFDPFGRLVSRPFLCPSTSWPGLKGSFPIAFSVWFGM